MVLSQSLSFPARRSRGDGMKKSVDGLLVKKDAKNARENGTRAEPTFATNGTVTSASALSRPSRRASAAVRPKEEIKHDGPSARRATLTSMPSIKQSSVRISNFFPICFGLRLLHFFVWLILLFIFGLVSLRSLVRWVRWMKLLIALHPKHPCKSISTSSTEEICDHFVNVYSNLQMGTSSYYFS